MLTIPTPPHPQLLLCDQSKTTMEHGSKWNKQLNTVKIHREWPLQKITGVFHREFWKNHPSCWSYLMEKICGIPIWKHQKMYWWCSPSGRWHWCGGIQFSSEFYLQKKNTITRHYATLFHIATPVQPRYNNPVMQLNIWLWNSQALFMVWGYNVIIKETYEWSQVNFRCKEFINRIIWLHSYMHHDPSNPYHHM